MSQWQRVCRALPFAFGLLLFAFCLPVVAAQQPQSQGASAPPPTRPPVVDPKAQALLDKIIKALGGPAFMGFKTLTTRGRTFSIVDESTAGMAPYIQLMEYPDKRRFTYGTKKPVVLINDGDQAWEVDQYGTTHQLPVQVLRWKVSNYYSLENLLRLRIHEPGVLIQMGGADFVDNLPAQVIEIVDSRQVDIKIYVNRTTFLPLRITYSALNPTTHEQDEYADDYSDFKEFDGVLTPMHIGRFINDERVAENFRNSAKYNETYPPGTFSPTGH
ncbi:MAG TPA: hypothetical protein VG204_08970 [Terriglobia bacterium]|nr:hypothetical protein [Terriglobia bacterium]